MNGESFPFTELIEQALLIMIRTTDRKLPLIVHFSSMAHFIFKLVFCSLCSIRTIVSYNHDIKARLPTSYIHFDQVSCFNVFFLVL